jgi:hypothetical protein
MNQPRRSRPRSRAARAFRLLAPTLACALLACAAAGAWAAEVHHGKHGAHVQSGSYEGTTGKTGGASVTFTVAANGKRILGFSTSLGYNGKCGQGGGPGFEIKVASMAISKKGAFSAKTTGTFPAAGVKSIKVSVSGHISGSKASGTVLEPGDRCSSSSANPYSETFTATHS